MIRPLSLSWLCEVLLRFKSKRGSKPSKSHFLQVTVPIDIVIELYYPPYQDITIKESI